MSTTPTPESDPAASTPATEPGGLTAASATARVQAQRAGAAGISFLESLRRNRMGVLTAALVVALVLGMLLSIFVSSQPGSLGLIILGTALAAAVGFTVRYLTAARGLLTQLIAFVAALLGAHIMVVSGAATGTLPALEQLGAEGASYNDALLVALATGPITTGTVLAGLVAAIIAGWGTKTAGRIDLE